MKIPELSAPTKIGALTQSNYKAMAVGFGAKSANLF